MIKFSIIIPVRKINDYLRENITELKKLSYKNFEVLILTDENEEYDFGDDRFFLYGVGPLGPGEKRNIGASKASGEILAFLDDDAYPEPDWLDKAVEVFEKTGTYALGGPAMTPKNVGFLEKMSGRVLESWMASAGTAFRHKSGKSMEINDYPTVNLLVKKEVFDGVGGFPIEFWPGEDTKLCLDMVKKQGKNFLYNPSPIVYHHRRNLFRPHLKQISRYGRHRGRFARVFPETSRLPSYFMPSAFLVGLVLGPLLCLIPQLRAPYSAVLGLYTLLLLIEGVKVYLKDKSVKGSVYVMAGIFLTHVVYGANFIAGFIKKPELQLRNVDSKGNYLGG